ncbi:tryptophan synthase subunit alpha, partial [uncultured Ruminobacter sp.]|uniref:tryptophan synthase subunit alpha n=1 Tax=uncultured Ruminobacter sp. TaxID=538947 RepID=UPI0025FF5D24
NGAPPALLGFGISKPEHVKQAIADGADGAISGIALVKILAQHLDDTDAMYEALKQFVSEMKAATKR